MKRQQYTQGLLHLIFHLMDLTESQVQEKNFQLTLNSKQWQQGIQEEIADYLQKQGWPKSVTHSIREVFVVSPPPHPKQKIATEAVCESSRDGGRTSVRILLPPFTHWEDESIIKDKLIYSEKACKESIYINFKTGP